MLHSVYHMYSDVIGNLSISTVTFSTGTGADTGVDIDTGVDVNVDIDFSTLVPDSVPVPIPVPVLTLLWGPLLYRHGTYASYAGINRETKSLT